MRKTIISIMAVAMLAISSIAAFAYEEGENSNLANNRNQCEGIGGEFEVIEGTGPGQSDDINRCTLTFDGEEEVIFEAGQSGNGWTTVTEGTVVIEKDQGPGEVVSVDVIEACYNPGGKLMKPGTGKCPTA